jgi:hypothetical protein
MLLLRAFVVFDGHYGGGDSTKEAVKRQVCRNFHGHIRYGLANTDVGGGGGR